MDEDVNGAIKNTISKKVMVGRMVKGDPVQGKFREEMLKNCRP